MLPPGLAMVVMVQPAVVVVVAAVVVDVPAVVVGVLDATVVEVVEPVVPLGGSTPEVLPPCGAVRPVDDVSLVLVVDPSTSVVVDEPATSIVMIVLDCPAASTTVVATTTGVSGLSLTPPWAALSPWKVMNETSAVAPTQERISHVFFTSNMLARSHQ
jgi:hypothetical protein